MAGGLYTLDPETGQPLIRTASGALMPLPLSEEDMQAAGAQLQLPDVARPDLGPDQRLALGPGGAVPALPPEGGVPSMGGQAAPPNAHGSPFADLSGFNAPVAPAQQEQFDSNAAASAQARAEDAKRAASTAYAKSQDAKAAAAGPAPGAVDPGSLARPGGGGPAQGAPGQPGTGGLDDPLVQQAMAEAMRGGGGGGPRQLGVAGETHKYKGYQAPMDPALAAEAQQAQLASEGYNEHLAISLRQRQQQAYEAQQGEFAARSGQLAAAQERFDRKQGMLAEYAAQRDSAIEEARQLKSPQMEDYWESKGTFASVMTGLSIALGGALQGLRGGQNPGLEMSNQAIERWLGEKREQYQRAERGIDRMDDQYARMVQQFGSEEQALAHMRLQAWEVRDGMLKSYAEKIGTPDALETYNQAMLQSEAEKAKARAIASQGAEVEIEQKLSMQGGGGGGGGNLLKMLRAGAEAKTLKDKITGGDKEPDRAITEGATEKIGGSLTTILAARGVKKRLNELEIADDDTDDPRSGAYDYVSKNIPGSRTRRAGQDLDQDTFDLARGAQQFLGKSDNDAALAEKQAQGLGASGRERFRGADRLEQKAVTALKLEVSGMTPAQRAAWFRALPAGERAIVQEVLGTDQRPAASEQVVR